MAFLKGRIDGNLAIVDKRLAGRPFMLGERPTIADISLCAYLYYPAEEFGFDIAGTHRTSPPGSTASRRCPAGSIPTT